MNIFFKILLILILLTQISEASEIDLVLENCIKENNYTNSGMISCTIERTDYYKTEYETIKKNLKHSVSGSDYRKILHNQNLFNDYKQALLKGEIKILYSQLGSIYPLFAENILLEINKTNFKILETLYKSETKTSFDKISIEKQQEKMDENINALKANLNSKQYAKILNTQRVWKKYQKDVYSNILPLINNNPQAQEYIKSIIPENRINILYDLSHIKD